MRYFNLANMVKGLTHQIVALARVGSNPTVRPIRDLVASATFFIYKKLTFDVTFIKILSY